MSLDCLSVSAVPFQAVVLSSHPTVAQQEAYTSPQPNSFFNMGSPLDHVSYIIMDPKQSSNSHG